jgi:hypothetical protein
MRAGGLVITAVRMRYPSSILPRLWGDSTLMFFHVICRGMESFADRAR